MAFHGFGTATRMLSPTFQHIFARVYWRDSEAQRFASPQLDSEAPLKGLEGGEIWDLYRKKQGCVKWTPSVQGTGGGGALVDSVTI